MKKQGLINALKFIRAAPQIYHSAGPQVILDNIAHVVDEALAGAWDSTLGPAPHNHAFGTCGRDCPAWGAVDRDDHPRNPDGTRY